MRDSLGIYIKKQITELISKYPNVITECYGKGLMIGIKCNVSNLDLTKVFREKRLLVVPASNNVIRLLPPLNITKKEAEKAIEITKEVVSEFK